MYEIIFILNIWNNFILNIGNKFILNIWNNFILNIWNNFSLKNNQIKMILKIVVRSQGKACTILKMWFLHTKGWSSSV
jgi:hypothetical protein